MSIPTPYVVGHRKAGQGGKDRYGNLVVTHASPTPVAVHSIAGPTIDGLTVDRDKDRDERVIMAPAGTAVAIDDLLVIDGADFQVDKVHDWTQGPWVNPIAGIEIHASREAG